MPTYEMHNKKTDEYFQIEMKIAEREDYFKNNPDIEQLPPNTLTIGDALKMGITKPDSTFSKYVLGRINEVYGGGGRTPLQVEKRWNITREI